MENNRKTNVKRNSNYFNNNLNTCYLDSYEKNKLYNKLTKNTKIKKIDNQIFDDLINKLSYYVENNYKNHDFYNYYDSYTFYKDFKNFYNYFYDIQICNYRYINKLYKYILQYKGKVLQGIELENYYSYKAKLLASRNLRLKEIESNLLKEIKDCKNINIDNFYKEVIELTERQNYIIKVYNKELPFYKKELNSINNKLYKMNIQFIKYKFYNIFFNEDFNSLYDKMLELRNSKSVTFINTFGISTNIEKIEKRIKEFEYICSNGISFYQKERIDKMNKIHKIKQKYSIEKEKLLNKKNKRMEIVGIHANNAKALRIYKKIEKQYLRNLILLKKKFEFLLD